MGSVTRNIVETRRRAFGVRAQSLPRYHPAASPPLTTNSLVAPIHIISLSCHVTELSLRGLSPHANYTDRTAAAGRRS